MAATRALSRPHSETALPARAACTASAVPQAPAPSTATRALCCCGLRSRILFLCDPGHRPALARLPVAQPLQEGGEDGARFRLETVGRIGHQQAAPVQALRVRR